MYATAQCCDALPTARTARLDAARSQITLCTLVKYADDVNLLVPENTDIQLYHEFANIQQRADENDIWHLTSVRPKK